MSSLARSLDWKKIDDFTLHLGLSERPATSRLRTTPEYACTLVRLETDLKKARALVSTLEGEDLELFREKREAYVRDLEQRGAEVENEVWGWLDVNSSEAIEKRCAEIGLPLEEGGDVTAESEDSALARRKEIVSAFLSLSLPVLIS